MLREFSADIFMLWQNKNAIVVGKHQNALAEINMDYVREKNITVVRRLSGGGTVFHDLGNLNFTFIMNGSEGHLVDFKKYTAPILEVLQELTVDARFREKSDLVINGMKFSGNAEHVFKNRVLHHGTLLFSSAVDDLRLALNVNPLKYRSKAVKSNRSRVTNISEHLKKNIDVLIFKDLILQHVLSSFPGSGHYEFSDKDIDRINTLKREKYITWEWNFGYSPDYELERSLIINGIYFRIYLSVSKGIIHEARISCDDLPDQAASSIRELLVGARHDKKEILRKLSPFSVTTFKEILSPEELVKAMF